MLKQYDNGNGYIFVRLLQDKVFKQKYVHRLIALNFIPNKENKPQVNHINGIKHDNNIENLEWCTLSENQRHRYDILKKINKQKGNPLVRNFKKVIISDVNGNIINSFDSLRIAANELKVNYTNLSSIINGKRAMRTKYIIRYEDSSI